MPTDPDSLSVKLTDPTFSRLLRSGFKLPHDPNYGLVILVRGKPGTGKSTLALQLLDQMQVPPHVRKYYCTLEQSKEDLNHKLASMLVAQAMNKACTPAKNEKTGHYEFQYPTQLLQDLLRPKLSRHAKVTDELLQDHQGAAIELFGVPNLNSFRRVERLAEKLTDIAFDRIAGTRIRIRDSATGLRHSLPQGAYSGFRSRVVMAERIIRRLVDFASIQEKRMGHRNLHVRSLLPLVVVDGLSLLSASERETLELHQLVELMRRSFQLSMLVYEPAEDESDSLDHHADMVIQLTRRPIERPLAYLIHELCIQKSRYQEAALGNHQFKIRGSGIAVFPSLHFQVHHHNYMDLELKRSTTTLIFDPDLPADKDEKQKEKYKNVTKGSLIDLILEPQEGESIVLLGSRNSFKTQLCLDFLSRGSWDCPVVPNVETKERGLLISLIDNAPDIERGLRCPWKKSLANVCDVCRAAACGNEIFPHAVAFCQRPGCITPAEFFHYIKERIDPSLNEDQSKPIVDRVVFWDLTQMDYRFPLFRDDKMLLPALIDMFKMKGLKSLFMGAGNAENTKAASAMADHVLFCWRSSIIPEEPSKAESAGKNHGIVSIPGEVDSIGSLMLYVDRTTGSPGKTQRSGKSLYRIPIDKDDRLLIPMANTELEQFIVRDLNDLPVSGEDRKQIERITNMQGVA